MAKSNRQRKHDRAVRQAKSARKQAAARQRQLTELAVQEAEKLLHAIYDPATPVEEFVSVLARQYEGEPVLPVLADSLIRAGSSPQRLVELSEAWAAAEAARDEGPSLTYLTFAAGVARVTEDTARARRLLDQALGQAGDPEVRVRLSMHLRTHGRVAEAVELLEGMLREDPEDEFAAEQYALTIEETFSRLAGEEPSGVCPCGSGGAWPDCCGRRERAALDRFGDRSGLVAFRETVAAYVDRSAYRQGVSEFMAGRLSSVDADEWDSAERESFAALAGELALILAKASSDDEPAAGASDEDDDSASVLTAFAADPDVPAEPAAIAREWNSHVHYGLWQIPKAEPAPGLWCTEIVAGVSRYVAFPDELIGHFPRWGVLLGAVVPVNGIWRSTGQALQLTPGEADALAETLTDAAEVLVSELAGKPAKRAARRMRQPVPFGRAEPHGVIVHFADAVSAEAARLAGMVTGSLLLGLAVEVHEHRVTPPAMTNTDGDPMCLIKARIAVRDPGGLARRLADHADFERDPDDPTRLVWLGRVIPENQRDAMLAEVHAQLDGAEFDGGELLSGVAQRWVRGQLQVRAGELVAEVNSRERLMRLVGLLGKLGESPSVIDETRLEPDQDMAWPTGPRVYPRGAAPAEEGWEKHWLDEPVPALHGRTPRQAAQSQDRVLLEAALREFEYEADILAADGKSGVDTAWLRQELDMSDDPFDDAD